MDIMHVRSRFVSIWSGIAAIVFFGDIFLDYKPFGYSGVMVGIFMWIIGSTITGMIFGPKRRHSKRVRTRRKKQLRETIKPIGSNQASSQFCIACGSEFGKKDMYCPECGTAAIISEDEQAAK